MHHLITLQNVRFPSGYKFDDKKPDSSALSIRFAHFPFRQPSDHDEERNAVLRWPQVPDWDDNY